MPSSPWTTRATSRPSIPPGSDCSVIRRRRSLGARSISYCRISAVVRASRRRPPKGVPASAIVEFLERCAAKNDDTHVDLAAHQMWGLTQEGTRVAVEIAVSKASLNRRDGRHRLYSRCHRTAACGAVDARERGAPTGPWWTCAGSDRGVRCRIGQFVNVNDNACRFFKLDTPAHWCPRPR